VIFGNAAIGKSRISMDLPRVFCNKNTIKMLFMLLLMVWAFVFEDVPNKPNDAGQSEQKQNC